MHLKNYLIAFILGVLCFAAFPSGATIPGIWQPLKIMTGQQLSYNYDVTLLKNGIPVDSIKGHLAKDGKKYLDSNSTGFAITDGVYYCKINYDRQLAYVYSIKTIQKKLHLMMDESPQIISFLPDTVITKYGTLNVDTSRPDHYIVKLSLREQPIRMITIYLERTSRSLEKIVLDYPEPSSSDDPDRYTKLYTLYDIQQHIPQGVFDLRKIFTINGNAVSLSAKYASYKLKTILN